MIEIKPVHTGTERKQFVNLPWKIYKNDPHWVPPIKYDVKSIFTKKHPFHEFGEAEYFLAYKDGVCSGRITAHINRNHNNHHNVREGFFGFYECIDDQDVAVALLVEAETWVRQRGMTKIIGPESFTIYDEVGFLTEAGRSCNMDPVLFHTHTPMYYLDQMEQAGFRKESDWYAYYMDTPRIRDSFYKIKERLVRLGYTFRTANPRDFRAEVGRIKKIFNTAWDDNWAHVPMTDEQFNHIAKFVKIIMDPRVIFFVEKDGEAVGAVLNLPDINPVIKKMNGRLLPFGWLKLLRASKKATNLRTFMLGVDREHRNKGIDIILILETVKNGLANGYTWSDCSLIVDSNRKMIEPLEKWGAELYKTFRLFYKNV